MLARRLGFIASLLATAEAWASSGAAAVGAGTSLALDTDGHPTLARAHPHLPHYIEVRRFAGAEGWQDLSFGTEAGWANVGAVEADQPHVAMHPLTHAPAIVWRQIDRVAGVSYVRYAAYDPVGKKWQFDGCSRLTSGVSGDLEVSEGEPTLAFSAGVPVVAFRRRPIDSEWDAVWVLSLDPVDGRWWPWGCYANVDAGAHHSRAPAMVVDRRNVPLVVWESDKGFGTQILARRAAQHEPWQGVGGSDLPGGISNTAGTSQSPKVVTGRDDDAPWVAWRDSTLSQKVGDGSAGTILLRHLVDGAWQSVDFCGSAFGVGPFGCSGEAPTLAAGPDGEVVVLWLATAAEGGCTLGFRHLRGGSWTFLGAPAPDWLRGMPGPCVSLPLAAHAHNTGGELLYTAWGGLTRRLEQTLLSVTWPGRPAKLPPS